MKRLLFVVTVLLFFGSGITALFWFGHVFSTYASSTDSLSVEKPVLQTVSPGTPIVLDLHGSGFNRETVVSLFMDVSNSEAVVGSFPLQGVYNSSLLYGDFLYLASEGGGLQVLNVQQPHQPQLLKEYLVGKSIIDIQRNGNLLFLSCGSSGISIMQISPAGRLQLLVDIAIAYPAIESRFVSGFLYVAAGSGGVLIYDLRNLEQIELVQQINSVSSISRMAVSGDYLYLAAAEKKIEIYHLTEPQTPVKVGSINLSEVPHDLIVQQQKLYIATQSGVLLYHLTDAGTPEFLRQWSGFGAAKKIFAGPEYLYIADSSAGLRIIDSEVESSPPFINLNIDPRTIVATADYLFVAGSNKGLLIVSKKALLARQVVKSINTPGSARDILLRHGWLYVAASRGGVLLYDLAAVGGRFSTMTSLRAESFAVKEDLLFVAGAKQGVEVFDISAPGQPELVVAWPETQALRLATAGDYLLAAQGGFGVDLIDITDIQHPVIVDALPDIHVLDITTAGSLIYIASKNEGLLIYEITGKVKLERVSSLTMPFPMNQFALAVAVQVQDEIAYVANGRSGLLLVDVSRPAEPLILSAVGLPGTSKSVRVVGAKAFVTSHPGGISVVDVADPKKPILLNNILMRGLSRGLQVADELIFITHKEMGVTAVPVPIAAETIDLLSEQRLRVVFSELKFPGCYSLQVSNQRETVVIDGAVVCR